MGLRGERERTVRSRYRPARATQSRQRREAFTSRHRDESPVEESSSGRGRRGQSGGEARLTGRLDEVFRSRSAVYNGVGLIAPRRTLWPPDPKHAELALPGWVMDVDDL